MFEQRILVINLKRLQILAALLQNGQTEASLIKKGAISTLFLSRNASIFNIAKVLHALRGAADKNL